MRCAMVTRLSTRSDSQIPPCEAESSAMPRTAGGGRRGVPALLDEIPAIGLLPSGVLHFLHEAGELAFDDCKLLLQLFQVLVLLAEQTAAVVLGRRGRDRDLVRQLRVARGQASARVHKQAVARRRFGGQLE